MVEPDRTQITILCRKDARIYTYLLFYGNNSYANAPQCYINVQCLYCHIYIVINCVTETSEVMVFSIKLSKKPNLHWSCYPCHLEENQFLDADPVPGNLSLSGKHYRDLFITLHYCQSRHMLHHIWSPELGMRFPKMFCQVREVATKYGTLIQWTLQQQNIPTLPECKTTLI